jgi:hypothetical protein
MPNIDRKRVLRYLMKVDPLINLLENNQASRPCRMIYMLYRRSTEKRPVHRGPSAIASSTVASPPGQSLIVISLAARPEPFRSRQLFRYNASSFRAQRSLYSGSDQQPYSSVFYRPHCVSASPTIMPSFPAPRPILLPRFVDPPRPPSRNRNGTKNSGNW